MWLKNLCLLFSFLSSLLASIPPFLSFYCISLLKMDCVYPDSWRRTSATNCTQTLQKPHVPTQLTQALLLCSHEGPWGARLHLLTKLYNSESKVRVPVFAVYSDLTLVYMLSANDLLTVIWNQQYGFGLWMCQNGYHQLRTAALLWHSSVGCSHCYAVHSISWNQSFSVIISISIWRHIVVPHFGKLLKTIAMFSTNRTTIKLRFSFRNQHIVCQLTLQALLLKFNLRILFFCLVFILEASSQDTGTVQIFLTSDHWSSVLKLVTVLWNGLRCFEIEFLDQETQDNEDMENYYYLHCAAALLPGNPILPLLSNHGPNCIQFIPWVEKRIKHHQLESS